MPFAAPQLSQFSDAWLGVIARLCRKYHSLASMPMFAQYTHQPPLITGLVGTVEGIAEAGEDMLSMKFPILMNAVLDIKLEHLSREKPPPADIRWVVGGIVAFFVLIVVGLGALLYFTMNEELGESPEEKAKKEQ